MAMGRIAHSKENVVHRSIASLSYNGQQFATSSVLCLSEHLAYFLFLLTRDSNIKGSGGTAMLILHGRWRSLSGVDVRKATSNMRASLHALEMETSCDVSIDSGMSCSFPPYHATGMIAVFTLSTTPILTTENFQHQEGVSFVIGVCFEPAFENIQTRIGDKVISVVAS